MRGTFFRTAALIVSLLGIPSLVWQVFQAWPPGGLQLEFFALQAIVLGLFLVYGLGLARRLPASDSAGVIQPSSEIPPRAANLAPPFGPCPTTYREE